MSSFPICLVDINTQSDFIDAHGAVTVPGGANLVTGLMQMFDAATRGRIPIISVADCHEPKAPVEEGATDAADPESADNETVDNGKASPPFCVRGTPGQQKPWCTLVSDRVMVEEHADRVCGAELFQSYRQVVYQKTATDMFSNPSLERAVSELFVDQFVVFGVPTETAVLAGVLGLIQRGRRVLLVDDTIAAHDAAAGDSAVSQMFTAGAQRCSYYDVVRLIHWKIENAHRAGPI